MNAHAEIKGMRCPLSSEHTKTLWTLHFVYLITFKVILLVAREQARSACL